MLLSIPEEKHEIPGFATSATVLYSISFSTPLFGSCTTITPFRFVDEPLSFFSTMTVFQKHIPSTGTP